jgi:pimeloyl-ACP methyl ester carboxylesterase
MVPWDWWVGEFAQKRLAYWVGHPDPAVLAEEVNRMMVGDERWDALSERTRSMLRAEGRAFQADMASQSAPFLDLADLPVPMVVGTGTVHFDERYRAAHRRLAELAGAQLYVGEGADHPAHSTHPEVWAGLVRATVASAKAAHG